MASMTTRAPRLPRVPRGAEVSGQYIILPRSEYAHLRQYPTDGPYVVDAIEYSGWSIGRDLRRLRRKAGLTLAEAAARARVRPDTLSRLENGQGNPTRKTMRKLLRALGAPEDE